MSIQALVGLPGHGKSYSAVELFILTAVKEGRKILTNIPLNIDELSAEFPEYDFENDFRFIDLAEWKEKPAQYWEDKNVFQPSALYLLDELWRIWPSGLKTNAIPAHQLSFIKEHRHNIDESGREPDIVLVTQNLSDIANAIRDMVETTIVCTKLTAVGKKNSFRRDYYQGVVKGFKGPASSFIRADQLCKYQPTVYRFYKSHTKAAGNVQQIDNSGVVNATIFGSFKFKMGVVVFVLLIGLFTYSVIHTKQGIDKYTNKPQPPTEQPQTATPSVAGLAPNAQTQLSPPPPPKESTRFKLVGRYISGQVIKFYLVTDGTKTRRIEPAKCKIGLNDECLIDGEIVTAYTGPSNTLASLPVAGFGPFPNASNH